MNEFENIWSLIKSLEPGVIFEEGTRAGISDDLEIVIIRTNKVIQYYSLLGTKPTIEGFISIGGLEFFLSWEEDLAESVYWPKLIMV